MATLHIKTLHQDWPQKGHTSHHGVGAFTDQYTRLVTDYEVLSDYCGSCALKMSELGKGTPDFDT